MAIVNGALVILVADGTQVGKANNVEIDRELATDTSNPIGAYHHEEVFYTGVEPVTVSFDVEEQTTIALTTLGIWPRTGNDFDIINFEPLTLEIHNIKDGTILHSVTGWLPTRSGINYTKGQKALYRMSGRGIRATDEAEN